MSDILLTTLNARYMHSAFALRYIYANLDDLRERASILEFTIQPRSLLFGANTPWNRVRLTRGFGTRAASRAMKSSGLSESRGGWVAVPALLIVSLWPLFREITKKNKIIIMAVIAVVLTAMFNVSSLKIEKRYEQAKNNILQYHKKDNSSTSIGLRFDMFEAAYWMFSENIIFGVGTGNYSEEVTRYYESNS